MDFYHTLGPLVLGSRLRRISEYFIAEVNKVYHEQGIMFDASWFPVFYLLSQKQPVSIRQISDELQVSHSAISQLIGNLKRHNLVEAEASGEDARCQLVKLSSRGHDLLQQVTPIWGAISHVFAELQHQHQAVASLFPAIAAIEQVFLEKALSDRIKESLTVYTP